MASSGVPTIGVYVSRFRHAPPTSPDERKQRRAVLAEDDRFWWRLGQTKSSSSRTIAPRASHESSEQKTPAVIAPLDPVIERAKSIIAASRQAFESGQLSGLSASAREGLILRSVERLQSHNSVAPAPTPEVDNTRDTSFLSTESVYNRNGRDGSSAVLVQSAATPPAVALPLAVVQDIAPHKEESPMPVLSRVERVNDDTNVTAASHHSIASLSSSMAESLVLAAVPSASAESTDAPDHAKGRAVVAQPMPLPIASIIQECAPAPIHEALPHVVAVDLPSVPLELPDADNEALIQRLRARFAAIDNEHQHIWRGEAFVAAHASTPVRPDKNGERHDGIAPSTGISINREEYNDTRPSQKQRSLERPCARSLPAVPDEIPQNEAVSGVPTSVPADHSGRMALQPPSHEVPRQIHPCDTESKEIQAANSANATTWEDPSRTLSPPSVAIYHEHARYQDVEPGLSIQSRGHGISTPPPSSLRNAMPKSFAAADTSSGGSLSLSTHGMSPSFDRSSSPLGMELITTSRSEYFDNGVGVVPPRSSSALSFALSWDESASKSPSPPARVSAMLGSSAPATRALIPDGGGVAVDSINVKDDEAFCENRHGAGMKSTSGGTIDAPQGRHLDLQPPSLDKKAASADAVAHVSAPALQQPEPWAPTTTTAQATGPSPGFVFALPFSLLPAVLGQQFFSTPGVPGASGAGYWSWNPEGMSQQRHVQHSGTDVPHCGADANDSHPTPLPEAHVVPQFPASLPCRQRELFVPPPPKLVWRLEDLGL